jgi:exodeoxyribonuclease VII small subunit
MRNNRQGLRYQVIVPNVPTIRLPNNAYRIPNNKYRIPYLCRPICLSMKKIKTDTFSYDGAYSELQTILEQLESGKIGIDEMPEQLARAQNLLEKCRVALRSSQASADAFEQSLTNDKTEA